MASDLLALLDTLDGLYTKAESSETSNDWTTYIASLSLAYPRLAQALRTTLTPTTDGEREAREALDRCGEESRMVHRDHLRTALALLAAERAKAADAARERAAIVADLQAAADDLDLAMREPGTSGADLTYFRGARDALLGKIAHYKSGAHNKVTP